MEEQEIDWLDVKVNGQNLFTKKDQVKDGSIRKSNLEDAFLNLVQSPPSGADAEQVKSAYASRDDAIRQRREVEESLKTEQAKYKAVEAELDTAKATIGQHQGEIDKLAKEKAAAAHNLAASDQDRALLRRQVNESEVRFGKVEMIIAVVLAFLAGLVISMLWG